MNIVTVTSLLLCLGLFGVMTRREIIAILASVELMLGAANIQLVAYVSVMPEPSGTGQAFGLMILVLAAAEAAVGLAILITMVRRSGRSRVEDLMEVEG
jgi:NADH-quinone oxidoreductase subunit K